MTQRVALMVATLLTVFLVVVIVGVGLRVAQQAAPVPATAAVDPMAVGGGAAASPAMPADREAAYQAALEQANQRLTEANRQLQDAYRQQQALAEQLQRLSQAGLAPQPVLAGGAGSAPLSATDSGQKRERHDHKSDHDDHDDD